MVFGVNFCIAYVIVDVLCLVLTVIISSNVSRDSGSELQVRYFFMLLTAFMVFVVFDAMWAILVFGGLFEPGEMVLGVVNGINVTATAFAGYFWFGFSLAYFESPVTDNPMLRHLTAVPALLVIVFHITGYFTGQNVIFMPDGSIEYGIMHIASTSVALLYLIAATIVALHKRLHATTSAERRMCLVFIAFMIAPAVSGVFDMFVPDMPVAAAGIMISVVFVIMSMQESRISNDALTGLNNRRRSETYLEESIARASEDNPVYLFIIDMDRFKSINDVYGHLEGDHALQLMANALRRVCGKANVFAGRWGGDEFVLIDVRNELRDPDLVAHLVSESLADVARESQVAYELACTVGYAKCDTPSESRARLISDADQMLYEKKTHRR